MWEATLAQDIFYCLATREHRQKTERFLVLLVLLTLRSDVHDRKLIFSQG